MIRRKEGISVVEKVRLGIIGIGGMGTNHANWYRTQSYYDAAGWKATWDGEGGGVLLNQCPHQIDLLQWLCGMPVKVRAFCHNAKWHNIEVEDDVTAYMEFENGATGVFVTTTADAPGTNRLELTFEMGKIVCEDGQLIFDKLKVNERVHCMSEKEGFKKPDTERIIVETDGENEQHVGVLKAFANKILLGTPLVAEGIEGIRGLTFIIAVRFYSPIYYLLQKYDMRPEKEEEAKKELTAMIREFCDTYKGKKAETSSI